MSVQLGTFRTKLLKLQYLYSIFVAGAMGVGVTFFPKTTEKLFGWKPQDELHSGIAGAAYLSFGLLSILGMKNPKKWAPILLLQMLYKSIWFIFVVGRLIRKNQLDLASSWTLLAGNATFVLGDLVALPFGYLFNSKAE